MRAVNHYVAAYLSGSNLLVAMPRAGVPGSDMFVSSVMNGPALRIQVKTGTQAFAKTKADGEIYLWRAAEKQASQASEFLWYAFVSLNGWPGKQEQPKLFFVPSAIVANCVQSCIDLGEWLCFWMTKQESEQYEGQVGLANLLKAIELPAV